MINNTKYFEKRILDNRKAFIRLERSIQNESDINKKVLLANEAINFAVFKSVDIFSSEIIEKVFIEFAESVDTVIPSEFKEKTILHVMTEAYVFGGHTRCVERWVKICKDYKQSCIILNQRAELPNQLPKIIAENGGEFKLLEKKMPFTEKAVELRNYASGFEYVILHIHMNDPIALAAFGTKKFKRPVLFFNHADHMFWVGGSISDHVAEITSVGSDITKECRKIDRNSYLGIPPEKMKQFSFSKASARAALYISDKCKFVFSAGENNKYTPVFDLDFYKIVEDVLAIDENVFFVIGGAKKNTLFWHKLEKKFPQRIKILGSMDYEKEYLPYLWASDLVLDSYPVGGGTFLIDALCAQKPILSLNNTFQTDFVMKSSIMCHSYDEFLLKVQKILCDDAFAKEFSAALYDQWINFDDSEKWLCRFKEILLKLPSEHSIYSVGISDNLNRKIVPLSYKVTGLVQPIKKNIYLDWLVGFFQKYFQIYLSHDKILVKLFGIVFFKRDRFI